VLAAGYYLQQLSGDDSFATGDANKRLAEHGIKIGNPSQCVRQSLTARRVFAVAVAAFACRRRSCLSQAADKRCRTRVVRVLRAAARLTCPTRRYRKRMTSISQVFDIGSPVSRCGGSSTCFVPSPVESRRHGTRSASPSCRTPSPAP
jgi:hypothetical protein